MKTGLKAKLTTLKDLAALDETRMGGEWGPYGNREYWRGRRDGILEAIRSIESPTFGAVHD